MVDADEEAYTVDRLHRMKATHEAAQTKVTSLDDTTALRFINHIEGNTVTGGSIIISQNQSGGQIAHQIINQASPPRTVSAAAADDLLRSLQDIPNEHVRIATIFGDAEAHDFAEMLRRLLQQAGWSTLPGVDLVAYKEGVPRGVVIQVSTKRPSVEVLGSWLLRNGIAARAVLRPGRLEVIVGTNQPLGDATQ